MQSFLITSCNYHDTRTLFIGITRGWMGWEKAGDTELVKASSASSPVVHDARSHATVLSSSVLKPLTKSSARSISGMRPGASQLFLQRTHLKKLAMSFSYISVSFCYGYGSVIAKYCYINYKWNLVWQSDKYLEIFGKFCSFWQKFLPNLEIKNLPLLFSQNYAPAKIKNNKLLGIT